MFFPVIDVDVCNAPDEQFELAFVKYSDKIRGNELIKSSDESIELLLHTLLDSPLGNEAIRSSAGGTESVSYKISTHTQCIPSYSHL